MGNKLGAHKSAAAKTGCSLDEWHHRRKHGEKWCIYCRVWKPITEFHKDTSRFDGLATKCKKCNSIRGAASRYRVPHREIARLRSSSCEICGRTHRLEIDHDHKTGSVRGVLCSRCNGALGQFLDSKELLLKAIEYLKRKEGSHGGSNENSLV